MVLMAEEHVQVRKGLDEYNKTFEEPAASTSLEL